MVAQPPHLVFGLGFDILLEGVCARLPLVAEHEILPDHDAQFVADGVELVGLVVAATPMTNHVHVGVARRLENAAIVGRGDTVWKAVEGDHVGALGEDRNPVHHQLKRAAPLVQFATQNDGAQSDLHVALFNDRTHTADLRGELVERLLAVTGGIPQLGVANLQGESDHIDS